MKTERTKAPVLVAVVYEVLRDEQFETLADLIDAIKFECGALRIGWTNDGISSALSWVARVRPLVDDPRTPKPRPVVEPVPEPELIDRHTAAGILRRLGVSVPEVTAAPFRDRERDERDEVAARQRAAEMGIKL